MARTAATSPKLRACMGPCQTGVVDVISTNVFCSRKPSIAFLGTAALSLYDGCTSLAREPDPAVAQDRLGLMYLYGDGVEQSTPRALQWIHRAAERGAPAAQMLLGSLYSAGNCSARNYNRAYDWFAIAATSATWCIHIYNIAQVRDIAYKQARSVARNLTAAGTSLGACKDSSRRLRSNIEDPARFRCSDQSQSIGMPTNPPAI